VLRLRNILLNYFTRKFKARLNAKVEKLFFSTTEVCFLTTVLKLRPSGMLLGFKFESGGK
jgi:hypothetical protein